MSALSVNAPVDSTIPSVLVKRTESSQDTTASKKLKSSNSTSAGEVLGFGSNECLQLGISDDQSTRKKPTLNKSFEGIDIVYIASGGLHNAAISSSGDVYTWGCNDEKALGRVRSNEKNEWDAERVVFASGEKIVSSKCGDSHTIFLTEQGRVYACGTYRDLNGVMGFSKTMEKQIEPVLIESLVKEKVVQIEAGENFDIVLTAKGKVYQWGNTRIEARIPSRLKLERLQPSIVNFPRGVHVKAVFATCATAFALSTDDRVFVWGLNNYGQCGLSRDENDKISVPRLVPLLSNKSIVTIAGGLFHTLALTASGTLLSFGSSTYGQLGRGSDSEEEKSNNNRFVPTVIPWSEDHPVKSISCGSHHSLALTVTGEVYAWGFGQMLQLGTGEDSDMNVPTLLTGSQLETRIVTHVAAGGQHSTLLAHAK